MTDDELAAVLRRYLRGLLVDGPDVVDAIERAIELLEREHENVVYGDA